MAEKKITYEEAFDRLDRIVEQLEQGNTSLEESLKLYQKGVELTRICNSKLEEAERRITIISENETGETEENDFIEE